MKLMRMAEVEDVTGYKKSTLFKLIKEGKFPRPVQLGQRAIGWVQEEVESWINERIKERDSRLKAANETDQQILSP